MSIRVACISVSAALGGSERVLADFAVRAPGLGIEPLVIVPKHGPLVEMLGASGITTVVAPADEAFLELSQRRRASLDWLTTLPRGITAWAAAIRKALADRGWTAPGAPAVLYSNGFKAHLSAALLRKHPRVWHIHEYPPGGIGPFWRLVAGALPDAVIANSESVAAAWRLPPLSSPVAVLNGVDLERFAPRPRSFWIHEQLALPRESRLVGMPAVFARWKGQIEVVTAFERIAARVPDAHLVLAGGTIYDTASERGFAAELVRRVGAGKAGRSVADRIHFVKFQSDPWRLYPEFEVTVHFSLRPEPFGRVIVESLACGVPVIAARAGGPTEIIEHGTTGWLVRPQDVEGLGELMVEALTTDRTAMSAAARRHAEAHFSADRFASGVSRVLHQVSHP
ncbi:MAG TPA: glycosyltransferase family 4 protein [Gemmatimonadales bacterium]|nr:glycosyltransferase family 4 protein [Gemmatimonadales bacterium]